jgi:hypothetical protein
MRQMRSEAETQLGSYEWVDREAGIARIPIERAMRLLAEGDVPVPGAARAAEGEAAREESGGDN